MIQYCLLAPYKDFYVKISDYVFDKNGATCNVDMQCMQNYAGKRHRSCLAKNGHSCHFCKQMAFAIEFHITFNIWYIQQIVF